MEGGQKTLRCFLGGGGGHLSFKIVGGGEGGHESFLMSCGLKEWNAAPGEM